MTNSRVHPEGWISVLISAAHEEQAKRIRADRDRQYGNIYSETKTDERWVGDLGEIAFKSWLNHEKIMNFQWVQNDAAGQPDFITANHVRIGVKTVKRKVPPKIGYTAQITARHAMEPIDDFFFMTYEIYRRQMWLLGAVNQAEFIRKARYYTAGEWVHDNYQIRPGHEIYNMEIEKLIPPNNWISKIR